MPAKSFTHHALRGEEKEKYLSQLEAYLASLERNLKAGENTYVSQKVAELAAKDKWDQLRMPREVKIYERIASIVSDIREEYSWLGWKTFEGHPENNRGYFEEVTVNSETGLPWGHDFLDLKRVKDTAKNRLAKMPGYDALAKSARDLLLEDKVEIAKVEGMLHEIHKDAMRRNFLEKLEGKSLLNQDSMSLKRTYIEKMFDLGAETLWNFSVLDYGIGSGMFQIYTIDAWQDNTQKPEVIDGTDSKDSQGMPQHKLSPELQGAINFGENNSAWYALKEIDLKFPSLHPVHLSKALIGPFENKYQTKVGDVQQLGVTKELLAKEPDAALLRMSRQYTYAPNHQEIKGKISQEIYRENWSDEIIIAPSHLAAQVSASVLGSSVRVFPL